MGNNFGEEFNLKSIAILGSTGSIGTQALEVIRQNPERFKVFVLTANNNADLLIKQVLCPKAKPAKLWQLSSQGTKSSLKKD